MTEPAPAVPALYGRVIAVHGSVVDVRFPAGALPAINESIEIERPPSGPLIAEVQQHLDALSIRAVALENTVCVCVPFEEVMQSVLKQPGLAAVLVDVFCRALKEAYAQVNSMALDDTVQRLIKVLIGLATKIGQRSGPLVQIPVYLTQEEIAQMAGARRERISTALNSLRRRGIVQYSARGHIVLSLSALETSP